MEIRGQYNNLIIINDYFEVMSSVFQGLSNHEQNLLSLSEQLARIVLSDN